jgi:hypothetical protein
MMPHQWDRAPRWSRAEALAYHVVKRLIEHWGYLPEEERKRMLSRIPKVQNG